jgi:endonuclease YncB( thermonuclease family)
MDCKELKNQTIDTCNYNLSGLTVYAKIVYVVDGDTVDTVFKYNDQYYKFRLRLKAINTPETKGPERPLGLFVKKFVNFRLLDKIVKLELYGFDNFGRLLSVIYVNDLNFNEYLVHLKYACDYKDRKEHVWNIDVPSVPFLRSMATKKFL